MIPQVSDCFDLARVHLGDTAVPGGQVAKDSMLQRFWPSAWNSLYRYLDRSCSKRLRRTQYYNLPANTSRILPGDIGIANMGRPQSIWERAIQSTFTATVLTVDPFTTGVPSFVTLTIPGHGLATGQQVLAFCFGLNPTDATISDDINADWYITVIDADTIRLNGCAARDLGNASGSLGIISTGTTDFLTSAIPQYHSIDRFPMNATGGAISGWMWENGLMRFMPSTSPRQLKITYMLSGSPPISGTTGMDDCGDALSLFLAATFAASKGYQNKAASLWERALGNPNGDTTNVLGGAFYELAQLGAQEINRTRIVIPRYRPRRNVGPVRQTW